jgi:hypothetical protein
LCLAGAAPAAAGIPFGYEVHGGERGLHWLLDERGGFPPFPSVTCHYGDDGILDTMAMRPPIVFAATESGPSPQTVG